MSQTIPVVSLVTLLVLSLVAKESKYDMTSSGLVVVIGVLAFWFALLMWKFG